MEYFFVFFGLGCCLYAVYHLKKYGDKMAKEDHGHGSHH